MTKITSPVPPLLTIPEAAAQLRVTPNTVWRWLADERFQVVRVGYVTRIRPADWQDFLLAHRQGTVTPHCSPEDEG